MDLQKQWSIVARIGNKEITINLEDWSLLGKGQGHIILQNNNCDDQLYWKVLMICAHDVHSIPIEIQQLYGQIIQNTQNIKEYLLKKEKVVIIEKERQRLKEFITLKLQIFAKLSHDFTVNLADNLIKTKQGWQYSLQFKPKSPLPEKYSSKFIQYLSQKLKIQQQIVVKSLSNRPFEEQTRWFKKNSLKKIKTNKNPLKIFRIQKEMNSEMLYNVQKIDKSTKELSLNDNQRKNISNLISCSLHQSGIMFAIANLQLLHTGSHDDNHPQIKSIWQKQQNKMVLSLKMKEKLQHELDKKQDVIEAILHLHESPVILQPEENKTEEDQILQMLKFLISWSWRDVSLFIRIKINHQNLNIEDIDFKIIDYELKESSKLKSTILKDEQILINYLKFLQII